MKIMEVSQQYEISSDTLRYYERIGLIPLVNRTDRGIRDYNELDLRRVEFIKCMRSAGLPIEVLIEYVGLVQQGDKTIEARKEILIEQRDLPPVGRFRALGLGMQRRDSRLDLIGSATPQEQRPIQQRHPLHDLLTVPQSPVLFF